MLAISAVGTSNSGFLLLLPIPGGRNAHSDVREKLINIETSSQLQTRHLVQRKSWATRVNEAERLLDPYEHEFDVI